MDRIMYYFLGNIFLVYSLEIPYGLLFVQMSGIYCLFVFCHSLAFTKGLFNVSLRFQTYSMQLNR